jgi:hypothetical protein
MAGGETLVVFEPANGREAFEGWALHATRRRKIHEEEARRLDRLRYSLGMLSTALAAIAGTSAFAAWQSETDSVAAAIATAAVGIGAAVLANMLAFLDLGARAEAHRRTAAAYKRILRDFEEASAWRKKEDAAGPEKETLGTLKVVLAEADASAPVVPARRGNKIERLPFSFVETAEELGAPPPRVER